MRSENEQAMVCQIGYHLQSEYEDKDLVFVGKYSVGKYINEQVLVDESTWRGRVFYKLKPSVVRDYPYKYLTTNINSCLNWSKEAFGNQYMMEEYFNYCGFDVHVVEEFTKEFYEENIQIATENGMKPYEIKDMGDYLIVCIGAL